MVITPANLDALFISFSKLFDSAFMATAAPLLESIGQKIPSTTRDQRYPLVQSLSGAAREWTGERKVQNVALDGFVVSNKKWENTLAVERTDLEFDQYAIYSNMLIPNLARHMKLLPDLQIAAAITANAAGYDGVSFFSSSHPIDPSGQNTGTQSNDLTTGALNSTNLAAVQAAMMKLQGPDAIAMGTRGDTILVPPSLEYTARTLANATFFPESKNGVAATFGAQTNMFNGAYSVVVSPYLPDTNSTSTAVWYLLSCGDASSRPFFWQEFSSPQLVSLVDPSNAAVFFQDKYFMGARSIGAAAASLWFKAMRVTP